MDVVDISQVSVALDDEAVGNQEVSFCKMEKTLPLFT